MTADRVSFDPALREVGLLVAEARAPGRGIADECAEFAVPADPRELKPGP